MKKRPQRQDPSQHIKFLTNLELHTDPIFAPAIQEAQLTGNGTWLAQLIQEQMPSIQQYMMELELEHQKAEADPFYPRPTIEEFSGDIPIATIPDQFEEQPGAFIMNIWDFMKHMFVCGSPGTGKSRGILAMIFALKALMGDKLSIWVFEPARSFRKFLYPNFKVLNFQDMRELFFKPPLKMPNHTWRRIFIRLFGTEQQFKISSINHLISVLVRFEKNGNPHPTIDQVLNILYQDLKNADSFRESDPIHTLINRLLALVEYESHSRNVHISTEDLMRMDIVFEIGDANSENDMFRAAHLISSLYYYKMLNGTGHYNLIIMDEGRELFSQTTTGFGESAVNKMFALARKMNIGFIVATQEPKSVSTTIKANVNTMVAFPLSDGKERLDVSRSLSLKRPQIDYYQGLSAQGHGHAIVKYAGIADPFPVQFPDVPDPDQIVTQEEIDLHNDEFLKQYMIPDPPPKPQPKPPPPPLILKDEERMLRIIHENPLVPVTEMYEKLGGNKKDANIIKSRLLKKDYIEQEEVKIKKGGGRTPKFMRLKPEACQQLKLKPRAESRAGIKHEIYCRLVRLKLEDEGWTCEFEGMVNPHNHPMDVLASKNTGLDIIRHDYEITTSRKNITDNINYALGHKLADKVIIIADDKEIEKCRNKTTDEQRKYGDALEFRPISDFYIS